MSVDEYRKLMEKWRKSKNSRIVIPQLRNNQYSNAEIKEILKTMISQMEYAEEHPEENDPYGTHDKDYQDFYDILHNLAVSRGIDLSEGSEDK